MAIRFPLLQLPTCSKSWIWSMKASGAKGSILIVMDVRMPEIDGIEACRCIKAVEALRDIPIIMMTGFAI